MESLVIVRPEAPNRYVDHSITIPEVRAVAATEAEAIEQVRDSLANWLGSGKLVRVQVPFSNGGNPWLESFGRSAHDPDFDEYVQEIQRARSTDDPE